MRYITELTSGAWTQLMAQREAAMRGDVAAQRHFTVLGGDYWGDDAEDLFDVLAIGVGHRFSADAARATEAVAALFGEDEAAEVVRFCDEIFEEIEMQNANRFDRILRQLLKHQASHDDLRWLIGRAERLPDELVLETVPFDGDEDTSRELWRKVVSGRKPWTCHYSRRPIRIGERHLVICETRDGVMLETRHSLLAVYLMLEGHDPTLPAHFTPVVTRRAA